MFKGITELKKTGVSINGVDIIDGDPILAGKILSTLDPTSKALVVEKLRDQIKESYEERAGVPLTDDYAKHASRPSLSEVSYGSSENDGYPFLPGHSPICDGKPYHGGQCKCGYKQMQYRKPFWDREAWPGGPTFDDLD